LFVSHKLIKIQFMNVVQIAYLATTHETEKMGALLDFV